MSETNSLNKTKTYTYNKLNQVISKTDEEGNITNYSYTYTGKVKTETKISNSGNKTTTYTYDQRGNMLSLTDSEGNITNYEYDTLNRLVKQIYADNKEVNYEYDTNNNLVQKTDPNGTIINYTYDSQNRLISKNITNGNGVIGITNETYSYDELGRLVEANDNNNHKLQFSYDSLDRMITETQSGSLVSYDYDNNNNITSITNPNNKTTNYTYDNLNRVTSIKQNNTDIATYNYTGLENTSLIYENNTSIIKAYDNLGRINSLNNEVNNYNYTYDDVNNITSDSIKNYLYDDIYRLKEVQNNVNQDLLESFNYDKVGNRINSFNLNTGSGASYDYETNILNQYTTLSGTTLSGSLNYTYDNNGNLKNDGEKIFSYDYKNRLTKVETSSGIIAQYSYDVLNRRYLKEIENEKVEYIYSNENILQEIITDETTNITTTKNYINGIGLDDLVAYETNNDIYYYHKNHLGSVEGITDSSGNIVVSYEYDSFGNAKIVSGNDNGNTRLYTGREYDKEIGLYYLRARYYNPELGRFISRDPIDIADDINLYAYVGNNPVNYRDLSGLSKEQIPEKLTLKDIWQDMSAHFMLNVSGLGGQATNLDISSYMLMKFMYGNGSSDYYGRNHWISKKVKESDFYKNQLNEVNTYINNNFETFSTNGYKDYGTGDIGNTLFDDFGTSFGTVNWTIEGKINNNGIIETNFNIKDTYIFNDFYSDGTIITNPFNVWAKYYQERGYGTPFNWELNITETFNY